MTQIFIIFDRDSHTSFDSALQGIADFNADNRDVEAKAITSFPSFEFWVSLHFNDRQPQNSNEALKFAQAHISGYTKGLSGLYALLEDKYAKAKQRSENIKANNPGACETCAGTRMDELVDYLLAMP